MSNMQASLTVKTSQGTRETIVVVVVADADKVLQVDEEVVEMINPIQSCSVNASIAVNLATSSNYAAFVLHNNPLE